MNRYRIEVERIEPNGDIRKLVEYRELKATKSLRGRDRQMENLVNKVIDELKYYQVLHKRFTVSVAWHFLLSNINPFFLINMQVTNSATVVDYFPEAFIAEADDIKGMKVTIRRFIKRVYFRATGQRSYSVIVATDAKNEWQSRINNGATVTDFNTDKMDRSEYMPMSCW